MKKIIAICFAGGSGHLISEHNSVKDAKKYYNSFLQMNKTHFVKAIGYIKLITRSEFNKSPFPKY